MSAIRNKTEFALALTVAAVATLWREAKGIITALRMVEEKPVSDALYDERMTVCQKCPIYFKPLRTCGSPLAKDPTKGCSCYLVVKARGPANCWLYDENKGDLGGGWPDELNSERYKQPFKE